MAGEAVMKRLFEPKDLVVTGQRTTVRRSALPTQTSTGVVSEGARSVAPGRRGLVPDVNQGTGCSHSVPSKSRMKHV